MAEVPYSNREIAEMFRDIRDTCGRIENQTTKTNGRVNKLEGFRQWLTGSGVVVSLIVIPLFGWMLYQVALLPQMVQAAVAQALLPYTK